MTTRRSRTHRAAPATAGARKEGVLKSLIVARRSAWEAVALGKCMLASSAAGESVGVWGRWSDIFCYVIGICVVIGVSTTVQADTRAVQGFPNKKKLRFRKGRYIVIKALKCHRHIRVRGDARLWCRSFTSKNTLSPKKSPKKHAPADATLYALHLQSQSSVSSRPAENTTNAPSIETPGWTSLPHQGPYKLHAP
jgi:hypothetical protein